LTINIIARLAAATACSVRYAAAGGAQFSGLLIHICGSNSSVDICLYNAYIEKVLVDVARVASSDLLQSQSFSC